MQHGGPIPRTRPSDLARFVTAVASSAASEIALDVTAAPPIANGTERTIAASNGDVALDATLASLSGWPDITKADYSSLVPVDPTYYVAERELARGGMGRIRVARDRRLGRAVAIKEVLVSSGELVDRFEREARINARLQHPAIMPVYEAGAWPSGEPFFSMRLVSGRSLDEVIAERPTLDERMALLPNALAVADAIAYAHSEGVIHRDLKPKNVLVGAFGETVVIDWGLAKDLRDREPDVSTSHRTNPGRSGTSLETDIGEVMGTPAYMPPEQAQGEIVDQRADVYAIGAMLYHLLAGRPPVTGRTAAEVLANVLDNKLEPLDAAQPGVPHDLLAIVAKAMAREAGDRYPTARELAEDLRRYQTGQLVGAHRYSARELFRRWLRRHRTAVVVGLVAFVVLAMMGAVSIQRIIHAEHIAQQQRARAEEQRTVAVDNQAEVEELLDFMLGDLNTKLRPVGKVELLADVAHKAGSYYDRRPVEVSPQLIKRSMARRNVGDTLMWQGDLPGAKAQYEQALASAQLLVGTQPGPGAFRELAQAYTKLGSLNSMQGDFAAALAWHRKAEAIRRLLLSSAPTDEARADLAETYSLMSVIVANQGKTLDAIAILKTERELREALAAAAPDDRPRQRNLARNLVRLGRTLSTRTDPAAVDYLRQAVAIDEITVVRNPTNAIAIEDLASSRLWLGRALVSVGKRAEAIAQYRAAEPLYNDRAAADPTNVMFSADLARFYEAYADALIESDIEASLKYYRASLAAIQLPAAKDPTNADLQGRVAMAHSDMGDAYLRKGDVPSAITSLRTALTIREQLVEVDPTSVADLYQLGSVQELLGDTLLSAKKPAEARPMYTAAFDNTAKLVELDPTNANFQTALAGSHEKLADVQVALGEMKAAIASRQAALAVLRSVQGNRPPGRLTQDVVQVLVHLGETQMLARQRDAALTSFREARAMLLAEAETNEDDRKELLRLADSVAKRMSAKPARHRRRH